MKFTMICLFRDGDVGYYKCFFGAGPTYGEFFLTVNARTLEAELTEKDPTYAAVLTRAFARTMRGV